MTERIFKNIVQLHGPQITEAFLRDYCAALEQQPVFDGVSWGWVGIFSQNMPMEFRQELQGRMIEQQDKPYGCMLCGEKEATTYHVYAGRVCGDCFATLPKE
jgi:hypothetical protein